jgi:hypothetical protein
MSRDVTVRKGLSVVTVSEPIDGSVQRKSPKNYRPKNKVIHHIKVDTRVMNKAAELRKPHQKIVIESATCVLLINDNNTDSN